MLLLISTTAAVTYNRPKQMTEVFQVSVLFCFVIFVVQ